MRTIDSSVISRNVMRSSQTIDFAASPCICRVLAVGTAHVSSSYFGCNCNAQTQQRGVSTYITASGTADIRWTASYCMHCAPLPGQASLPVGTRMHARAAALQRACRGPVSCSHRPADLGYRRVPKTRDFGSQEIPGDFRCKSRSKAGHALAAREAS